MKAIDYLNKALNEHYKNTHSFRQSIPYLVILFIILLMFVSCTQPLDFDKGFKEMEERSREHWQLQKIKEDEEYAKNEKQILADTLKNIKIVVRDGCEYYANPTAGGNYVFTHKGNCTNIIHKSIK
jgi:hypothetical protein